MVETERLTICYMLVIPRKWQDLTEEEKLATRERINNDIATQKAEGKTVIVVDNVPAYYAEAEKERIP